MSTFLPDRFKVKTERGPEIILASVTIQGGINDSWDAGGEFFTSIGGSGFKAFSKYAFLDSSSKWAMAAMPLIGFAWPWFNDDEDEDSYTYLDDEIGYSVSTFLMEFTLPMSYHPSPDVAFFFSPKVYYHVNWLTQTKGESANFKREGSGNFFSPGISLGFKYKALHMEGTAILMDNKTWVPFLGAAFSTGSYFTGDSAD